MEQLFEKYQNIQLCMTKYRAFSLIEGTYIEGKNEFLDFAEFKRRIQLTSYIVHHMENKKEGVKVDIYLFKSDSKYMKTTSEFTKLLDRYREPFNIIIFSKEKLSTYLSKAIKRYPSLKIDNFLHKHFTIELSKGPLCSVHEILSPEEVKEVCLNAMAHGHKFPAIPVDDPQNIWIGGKINDLVRIVSISEITGKSVRYRIITPVSGKIGQSSIIKKVEVTANPDEPANKPSVEEVDNFEDFEDDYE